MDAERQARFFSSASKRVGQIVNSAVFRGVDKARRKDTFTVSILTSFGLACKGRRLSTASSVHGASRRTQAFI